MSAKLPQASSQWWPLPWDLAADVTTGPIRYVYSTCRWSVAVAIVHEVQEGGLFVTVAADGKRCCDHLRPLVERAMEAITVSAAQQRGSIRSSKSFGLKHDFCKASSGQATQQFCQGTKHESLYYQWQQ